MGTKKWRILYQNNGSSQKFASQLASHLQISPILAKILINRGIDTLEKGRKFLFATLENLADPWELPDLQEAVERILRAIQHKERILVYGDYDVDGITGTALLTSVLKHLGGQVSYYIPDRLEEGYGINIRALEWAKKEAQIDLIITVDCGIASREEVNFGRKLGLDIIITDHHEPGDLVPRGVPVINPKLKGSPDIRDLAGVGVAFKLAQALCQAVDLPPVHGIYAGDNLDLVTLGTIADVVPLLGENRLLIKYGLPFLSSSQRPGIKALIEVAGLTGKNLSVGQVAFILAPRLNAAGRLGHAAPAVELLLTSSEQKAWELAKKLNRENGERQLVETQIYHEVCEKVEKEIDFTTDKVIVLASPLWHSGVIGIVASKVTERYHRPTILLSIEGETAKGSGRSIPGFNLFKALDNCQEVLLKFGGHSQAAGLTVKTQDIPLFKKLINQYAEKILTAEILSPTLSVDCEILPEQINDDLYQQLQLLQPFGYGNPEPVLCCRKAKVVSWRYVGKDNNHLKLKLNLNNEGVDAIGFNFAHLLSDNSLELPAYVDLAFTVGQNEWQGNCNLQLKIVDLHFSTPFSVLDFNIKLNLSMFLDKLLINSQLGIPSVVQVPLRRLKNALDHFLQRHLFPYGVKVCRLEDFRLGHENYQPWFSKSVLITTEPYWNRLFHDMAERCLEVFNYHQFFSPSSSPSEVIDKRGTDKIYQLEQLINLNEYLVVYLNYRATAQNLAAYLVNKFPQLKGKVKLFFGNKDADENLFDPKNTRVLLTDQFLEFYQWPYPQLRVIFEPPFSIEEFHFHLYGGQNSPLYLLWNEQDLSKNDEVLQALFPNEEFLTELLAIIRDLEVRQPLNLPLIAKFLNISETWRELKLHSSLKILRELGIIEWKNGTYYSNCFSEPVIFAQSPYYCEGQRELEAWAEFLNSNFPWKKQLGVG